MLRRKFVTLTLLLLAIPLVVGTSAAEAACPNEAFRVGPSAGLPDCRAYELVTPPDTNGRMLEAIEAFQFATPFDLFPTELAAANRDSFLYLNYASGLPEPLRGSGDFDLYAAERSATGWNTTHRFTPLPTSVEWSLPGGVAPDHTYSFSNEFAQPYLQSASGTSELVGIGSLGSEPESQGRYISDGGQHVIFTTGHNTETQSAWCHLLMCPVHKLEPNAPPEGTGAVYDRPVGGPTRVISLLPGNVPLEEGEDAFYKGVSKDGSVVAFDVGTTLYVRVNDSKTEEAAAGGATYAGLSGDGHFLFYVLGGVIHRFDTTLESDLDVNPGGEGEIVNISADGSHVYFISTEEIGGEGQSGEPNLYVWTSGGVEYVATVASTDLESTGPTGTSIPALTRWTDYAVAPNDRFVRGPGADSSRTTPDGNVLVFESRAELTSYDNDGHTEIYRYDDVSKGITCVSCNPMTEPATGDARFQELHLVGPAMVIHNLTADGSRVFFETPEALVGNDTNEIQDAYEWNEEESTEPRLITSGKSPAYPLGSATGEPGTSPAYPFAPRPNLLLSVTPNGSNVFFTAQESLVPGAGENGTQAIYDARVGGGFPAPSTPKVCVEEECRASPAVSGLAPFSTQSETTVGNGNVKPQKRHCRQRGSKPKQRKKRRCSRHRRKGARTSSTTGGSTVPAGSETAKEAPSANTQAPVQESGPSSPAPVTYIAGEEEFKIELMSAELSTSTAGMHPDLGNTIEFSHFKVGGNSKTETAGASPENIAFRLPPGLLGNPQAVRTCSMGDFVSYGNCPSDAQIGMTKVRVGKPLYKTAIEPVYNIAPPHPDREVARLGFIAYLFPVFIDVGVRTAGDYGVTATVHSAPGLGALIRAETTLWGDPASSSHDKQRAFPYEAALCPLGVACLAPEGKRPSTIPAGEQKAFLTNPSACQEGQVDVNVQVYQQPGVNFEASGPLSPITDCSGLPFNPSFSADPTSHVAGAPTGLETKLVVPQHLGPGERATATMREARVTLPAGMQVAAGAANWIGTCSEAEIGYHEEVAADCPDSSKLGTATIISPALSTPIEGSIYQRSPRAGHQLGLWLSADALGLHVKLPGELEPDPSTGRLTAVFRDLPQVPVEEIDLNVWGGPRAPLQNPDHCGVYNTDFTFSPHSDDAAAVGQSTMEITEGCNQPFNPTLHAGVTEPVAGKYSPFVFDLTRPDSDQALRGFDLKLPKGELAKIKGVPLCPDPAAAAASCPASSRIGSLQATTGPGPEPFTLPAPGKAEPQIYLAGPYQGSPFSIVSEVPAQAGPFDLGTLAVRSGLAVEPETGIAVVKADPLPQFFEGVGIAYRHLRAVVDRPEFNINPTDCRELAVTADVTSTQGAVAHPQARFQVDGCKALKFKPKLTLKLKGGTKRASYPALSATLKARKGDANIAFTSVALPHSEFLAQEHIGTICTRVQFAADACPKGSVYGKAKAWTPLLEKPLQGPVYLRSSSHPLPDLVAKLGGQLEIDLVGRIDSVHGGIRATFESVPDAPVSKFTLQMKGGAKSLLTNSTDICQGTHRVTARMKAQNGRAVSLRPVLKSSGCGKKKLGKHKKHH